MGNDITVMYGIIIFFVLIGVIAPYLNAEFNSELAELDPTILESGIDPDDARSTVGAFNVIGSVFAMFFWTFGIIPVWFDLIIFLPLRITLALIVARNIWIGGGG